MNWRPWRREPNGEAQEAIRDAEADQVKAHKQTPKVDRTTRVAKEVAKRTDRFARDLERSWRPRESP